MPPSSYPTTDVSGARHLVDALARKEVEPALEWLQKNAPEEEALIFDLQKQQFIKLLQEGLRLAIRSFTCQAVLEKQKTLSDSCERRKIITGMPCRSMFYSSKRVIWFKQSGNALMLKNFVALLCCI